MATDIIFNASYHGILALDPLSSLQRSVFMSGRGFSYFAETPGLPLSLKCMANGRALYKFGRAEVAVDDGGYLILNDRQPYSIEIASPTQVETFVLWFPDGWAEEVLRGFNETPEMLMAKSPAESGMRASFFERYTPHDRIVSPKVHALRAAFKSEEPIQDGCCAGLAVRSCRSRMSLAVPFASCVSGRVSSNAASVS